MKVLVTEIPRSHHLVFSACLCLQVWNEQRLSEGWTQPAGLWFYLGGGPLPRPRPGPAPGPGPGPLGPGGRLTGPRALGLGDARATSFCKFTPLPVVPGFVLVGFESDSGVFSVQRDNMMNQMNLQISFINSLHQKMRQILNVFFHYCIGM